MAAKTRYLARRLVSTTEGGMYGVGEEIAGAFDPKDDHNAALIDSGAVHVIKPSSSGKKKSEPEPDGGDASPPSMDDEQ